MQSPTASFNELQFLKRYLSYLAYWQAGSPQALAAKLGPDLIVRCRHLLVDSVVGLQWQFDDFAGARLVADSVAVLHHGDRLGSCLGIAVEIATNPGSVGRRGFSVVAGLENPVS